MASSFRQWESDPLFSAAEVVQDSADRMDSIFRILLHEQTLIQENHQDAKLLKSIEYYRRDLATAVETARWQLEDFEREVNLSAKLDKSHARENVISRHRQFISAIREQILDVERTLNDMSSNSLAKGSDRGTQDEQDQNGLALFLSGESKSKHIPIRNFDDSNSMIRFLDPKSSNLENEIVQHNSGEHLHMNGAINQINRNFEASCSILGADYNANNEVGCLDLEASEEGSRSFFDESRSRGYNSKMKIFGSLPNLWFMYGNRASRSFTKRWKDGEELTKSQCHALQGNCRQLSLSSMYICLQAFYSELVRCRRSSYYAQAKGYSVLLIPAIILTLIVLGILLF